MGIFQFSEMLGVRPCHDRSGTVDNNVFQDQQANAELAKIMGEFTESGDQPTSASSKGDDLLAMMDGLWGGTPWQRCPREWAKMHCQLSALQKRSLLSVLASEAAVKPASSDAFKILMSAGVLIGCQFGGPNYIVNKWECGESCFKLQYTVIVCLLYAEKSFSASKRAVDVCLLHVLCMCVCFVYVCMW